MAAVEETKALMCVDMRPAHRAVLGQFRTFDVALRINDNCQPNQDYRRNGESQLTRLKAEIAAKLDDALARVIDEPSFLIFIAALATDWFTEAEIKSATPSPPYSSGALGWENGSIGAFLESSRVWATASSKGLKNYSPPENPWRRTADILMAGKIYE